MRAHYLRILEDTEKNAEKSLRRQCLREGSPYYGAFAQEDGVYQAKSSIYAAAGLIAVYANPDSRYYHDARIYAHILLGLDYVDRAQHENGLFDYVTCNFDSAPDTAFCVVKLIPHLKRLRALADPTEEERTILFRVERIVRLGGRGLTRGGFHTPNHRWAIASVLCACAKLFGEQDLAEAASVYLNEGIDCNADGEYSERSAGNYNSVNNDAMLLLAEALSDDSFEQHVIRNLRMMLTYWEPDDSVFTANSTRFDKDRLVYPVGYYFEYLHIGVKYHIPEYIAMANHVFDVIREKGIGCPDVLIDLMNRPDLIAYESAESGTPRTYQAFYAASGIARTGRDRYTWTLMRDKSDFLYVHNGSIKLAVKIGGSFCEHRAFRAERIWQEPDGAFHLRQTMRGWYYLPFDKKPETSDWWSMDNASRPKKLGPDVDIHVIVREIRDGLQMTVEVKGVSGAPWRVELAFNGIDRISNEHMTMPVHGDEVLVLRDSMFTVQSPEASMEIGPAFGEHHFTEGKEDSEAKTPGAMTVYLTGYTPFAHTVVIRP